MAEWEFSAMIEEDGDLALEWYKDKGSVVTICINANAHDINWAALIDGVSHHGCIKGYPGILRPCACAPGYCVEQSAPNFKKPYTFCKAAKSETGSPLSDGAKDG